MYFLNYGTKNVVLGGKRRPKQSNASSPDALLGSLLVSLGSIAVAQRHVSSNLRGVPRQC